MESKKVLVIEDELIVALDVAANLESLGYTVMGIVDNGEEAILAVSRERPDLLVMDINIKGDMTGVEAYHLIRELGHIPVLFLTGYQLPAILKERIGAKMEYMAKPFDPEELQAVVECMLKKGQPYASC